MNPHFPAVTLPPAIPHRSPENTECPEMILCHSAPARPDRPKGCECSWHPDCLHLSLGTTPRRPCPCAGPSAQCALGLKQGAYPALTTSWGPVLGHDCRQPHLPLIFSGQSSRARERQHPGLLQCGGGQWPSPLEAQGPQNLCFAAVDETPLPLSALWGFLLLAPT